MWWIATLGLGLMALAGTPEGASAQQMLQEPDRPPPSRCLALAQAAPAIMHASYGGSILPAQAASPEVTIRFVGHATFLITTPEGVTIATDYDGWAGGIAPRVVTMNRAHSGHNTPDPDPAIEHVLRGWNPEGGPARHNIAVDDVVIRNVPTDLRSFGFSDDGPGADGPGRMADGNSIFIFEVAGLCIGHLGHLHHLLEPADLGWIGQLDVVMVPVDGTYTLAQTDMAKVLDLLKARLVLPMHYFTASNLQRFIGVLSAEEYEVVLSPTAETTISVATLPERPTVLVLPGN